MHAYQECDWETRVLDKSAIMDGDFVKITPISGSSRTFKITRTQIDFVTENYKGETSMIVKKLPCFKSDTIFLRLEQTRVKTSKGNFENRFILSTKNGRPFWHNGSMVFSVILTSGDEIEIGYNKINFFKKAVKTQDDDFSFANEKIIKSVIPIMIEGKTGTGKSTLARKIHEVSGRSGEFVHLNMSAFSESLLESELFGHVRGAFTGALSDKKGAIMRAHNGTLFLDEIDSTSLSVQVKLLLFLDNLQITPVGSSTLKKVDCRIIFASGSSLRELVQSEKIRKDFYHRVSSGQCFKLPCLSDNPNAIEKYCDIFEKENNVIIEKRLRDYFQQIQWSGNFRQLKGHLERKRLLASGHKIYWSKEDEELLINDPIVKNTDVSIISVYELRDNYCLKAYYECHEQMGVTAKALGISVKCLRAVLKRKGVK